MKYLTNNVVGSQIIEIYANYFKEPISNKHKKYILF
jgi:hypothetical protein